MNKFFISTLAGLTAAFGVASGEDYNVNLTPQGIPGMVPQLNNAPTGGYGSSTVQTQLKLEVKDSVGAIHFIRDNTDPYVLTRAYVLKNAEPYALRGYLLAVVKGTKLAASPVQVDALKFNDGTGLLLVSAEDYRFRDSGNGESIDRIIERLDKPGIGFSSGRPKFIYYPKVNAAANLRGMVANVGAAGNDVEFTNGVDVLLVDGQLNALVYAAPYWSAKHVQEMLEQYDKPMPEVRISYKLVEIYAENDDKIGADFQSWKNNDGVDFFSAGGRYRNNWASTFAGGVNGSGSSRTDFFNFNPKWNSKYLDFLSATGKAKVVTSGVLLAKNRADSQIQVNSGLFYIDSSTSIPDDKLNDKIPEGKDKVPAPGDLTLEHGKELITKADNGFQFKLTVNPVVTQKSTTLALSISGTSLIGWNGDGTPRVSKSAFTTEIQVGNSGKDFVVGGISKVNVVRGVAGVPLLKDLPVLGWLFATESESTKRSQLVLIARAEYALPFDKVEPKIQENVGKIIEEVKAGVDSPTDNLGFQQLGFDGKELK